MPTQPVRLRFHALLLLTWIGLGAGLRLFNLEAKSPWTDEFATLVFSLGHSFQTVPVDQVISAETLLQPLVPDQGLQLGQVLHYLLSESTHPPFYFWLTHLWLQLFQPVNGLVSLWGARSLAVLFGVIAIPGIFGFAYLALGSLWVAQLSALLMATSPLAIYLAQEARHYTLPVLGVMASLACFIYAWQRYERQQRMPGWLVFGWISINGLGIACHYFFSLTLMAEGLVVLGVAFYDLRSHPRRPRNQASPRVTPASEQPVAQPRPMPVFWQQIGLVALGTLATMLVWLPLVQGIQESEITQWTNLGDRMGWQWWEWLKPLLELFAQPITILYLLPLPNTASVIILVLILIWSLVKLYQGLQLPLLPPANPRVVAILGGFICAALFVFLAITYGLERDVTSAIRYYFVFFPIVLVLMATALVALWQQGFPQRRAVGIVVTFSLIGALTVVSNLGLQKVHRPDLLTADIRQTLPAPTLITMLHRTHGQTGRLMAVAWALWQQEQVTQTSPLFLLAHQDEAIAPALQTLADALASASRPLNLWLVNFDGVDEQTLQAMLRRQGCVATPEQQNRVDGYRYRLHRCWQGNKS